MIIRCRSKSNLERYHAIEIAGTNQVHCYGEEGFFCSHIDAVINYGLVSVVHPDDRHLVAEAQTIAGPIQSPQDWKATWMRDGTWINGYTSRAVRSPRVGYARLPTDKPGVCFSGTDPNRTRKQLSSEANDNGWTHTTDITSLTQVLVLADKSSTSRKARKALQDGIPICNYDEWREEMASPSWTRG